MWSVIVDAPSGQRAKVTFRTKELATLHAQKARQLCKVSLVFVCGPDSQLVEG